MDKITYIYILSDPITDEVKYVGKSINPKKRLVGHIRSGRNLKRVNLVNNWINSLYKKGLKPKMDVIDEIEGDWEWLEEYWIGQFKCWGFKLKNITLGGDHNPMDVAEVRKKVSDSMKKIVKSKEWCENISNAKKNISVMTEDGKRRLSLLNSGTNNPMYGKKHTIESLKKMRVPVLQYDLEGNLLKRWDSCTEASNYIGGKCQPSHIARCARGERKTSYGYRWVYVNNKGRK